MKKKIICTILILLFVCGLAFSIYQLYGQFHEYEESKDAYADLSEYIKLPDQPEEPPENSEMPGDEQSQYGEIGNLPKWPEVDFEKLEGINPDIVGWIYLEGSRINYPIVQSEDNQYYLKHLFDRSSNNSGCIFLDFRNNSDFTDRHSIIYGHHMKNGTMFTGLDAYKNQEYYDEHPRILLMMPEQNYVIEIFSGYVASVEDDSWQVDFLAEGDFEEWLGEIKERSCFVSENTPAVTDRIITLSTCSYEFNNARFVLHGVLL